MHYRKSVVQQRRWTCCGSRPGLPEFGDVLTGSLGSTERLPKLQKATEGNHMKAWQFVTENHPLELHDVPDPVPGPGELVLDVKGAGICHSDVGFLDGTLSGLLPKRPITLGHEIAGVVSALGPGVTAFTVGQIVAIPCDIPTPGTSMDGGFAEKVLTPARFVIPVPDGVAFDQAAAATDAGMTA